MYLGRIVEVADGVGLYEEPKHPYAEALLSAVPAPSPVVERSRSRIILEGDVPSPIDPPAGCNFHPRCPKSFEPCPTIDPMLASVGHHEVACHLYPASG